MVSSVAVARYLPREARRCGTWLGLGLRARVRVRVRVRVGARVRCEALWHLLSPVLLSPSEVVVQLRGSLLDRVELDVVRQVGREVGL